MESTVHREFVQAVGAGGTGTDPDFTGTRVRVIDSRAIPGKAQLPRAVSWHKPEAERAASRVR